MPKTNFVFNPFTGTFDAIGGLHSQLDGLLNDDHLQYFLLAGRIPGQIGHGGFLSGLDLTFRSNPTNDGKIILGDDVASSGSVVVHGTGTGITIGGSPFKTRFFIHDQDAAAQFNAVCGKHTDTASVGSMFGMSRSRGTESSPTIISDGDVLAQIVALGFDGAEYEKGGQIQFKVDDPTPGDTSMGTSITLSNTLPGSTTPTDHMLIRSDGSTLFTPSSFTFLHPLFSVQDPSFNDAFSLTMPVSFLTQFHFGVPEADTDIAFGSFTNTQGQVSVSFFGGPAEGTPVILNLATGGTTTVSLRTLQNSSAHLDFITNLFFSSVGTTEEFAVLDEFGNFRIRDNLLVGMGVVTDDVLTPFSSVSAGIELQSKTAAVLLSRLTSTQRDALTPVDGMLIYNSDEKEFEVREDGEWVAMGTSSKDQRQLLELILVELIKLNKKSPQHDQEEETEGD